MPSTIYLSEDCSSLEFLLEVEAAQEKLDTVLQAAQKRHKPETTGERLRTYILRAEWTVRDFMRLTHLNKAQYFNLKNHPKIRFKFRTCLAIAVGLGLTYKETADVLSLSGMGFDNGDPDHFVYAFILFYYPGASMEFFNAVCEKTGVAPLGSEEYQEKW